MSNDKKILIILLVLTFTLSGCFISFGEEPVPKDGGIFKSYDAGETWHQRVLMPTISGNIALNTINVLSVERDPQDRGALYLLTRENGIYFSYTSGESWFQPRQLNSGRIEALEVNPESKCIIYAAQKNNIYKSTDCNRSWQNIFVDPRSDITITALAVDRYDTSIVYAGNSSGEIMRSADYGVSWKTIERLGNKIVKMMIDPGDVNVMYIATSSKGIFKSYDGGLTWDDLSGPLKEYSGSLNYRQLIFSPSEPGALLYASNYGILKSSDGGASWDSLRLITPDKKVSATAIAIDPVDPDKIYYTTAKNFLYSVDGGINWKSKKLQTSRSISELLVDPKDPKIMYMATVLN